MSNEKGTSNKKKKAAAMPKRKKYADDRTPAVKKIDMVCKALAIVLALLFVANVHVLMGGGGYDDTKIVTVMGYAGSKINSDVMAPEIEARSAIFTKTQTSYEKGDVIQYFDGKYNPARRIVEVSEDEETYTVVGDNEAASEAVEVKAEDVRGKVIMNSTALYGFIKVYHTALGAAVTLLLSFALLMVADLLMYKKRKAALQAKREAIARKEARKLKVKQGLEELGSVQEEEDPIEKRRAEKEAKLEKERAEIAAEMKQLQKKMKAEEDELKRGKRGKK